LIYPTVLGWVSRSQVKDGPTRPERASSSCSATATPVSANASETEPAKLRAVFVVDKNEKELTIPFGN
jgi:hypothetical protein